MFVSWKRKAHWLRSERRCSHYSVVACLELIKESRSINLLLKVWLRVMAGWRVVIHNGNREREGELYWPLMKYEHRLPLKLRLNKTPGYFMFSFEKYINVKSFRLVNPQTMITHNITYFRVIDTSHSQFWLTPVNDCITTSYIVSSGILTCTIAGYNSHWLQVLLVNVAYLWTNQS